MRVLHHLSVTTIEREAARPWTRDAMFTAGRNNPAGMSVTARHDPSWMPISGAGSMLTLGAKIAHRLAHAERSGNGAVRRLEGRHHGIAMVFRRPPFRRRYLLQQPEMLVDEIEGTRSPTRS